MERPISSQFPWSGSHGHPESVGASRRAWLASAGALALAACAVPPGDGIHAQHHVSAANARQRMDWLDRLTWGATSADDELLARRGLARWLSDQLHPESSQLPGAVEDAIQAMTISQRRVEDYAREMDQRRRSLRDLSDPDARQTAQRDLNRDMDVLLRETRQREMLLAVHSSDQLRSVMTWFWLNHFSVYANKSDVRMFAADYVAQAIRRHALGKFRNLLGATQRHPAMLRYLDSDQNTAGHLNENYAREIMELHTLGVGHGYTQADVQVLARVLTGTSVDMSAPETPPPRIKGSHAGEYFRDGLFVFNPARHDDGLKTFLGSPLKRQGLQEIEEALDRLAKHPSTAHFVSMRMAVYLAGDAPPRSMVDRMARTFQESDGDIPMVLTAMFESPEFAATLGHKFRDPMHFVTAGVRLVAESSAVLNPDLALDGVSRLGESLLGHETPEGYSLVSSAWNGPGQMAGRFEVARMFATRGAVMLHPRGTRGGFQPTPDLSQGVYRRSLGALLAPATSRALAGARNAADWNTLLLASPDFMIG